MSAGQATRALCNQLVRVNLGTCFLYAGLANTELRAGERRLAERSFALARSSHAAIQRFLSKLEDEPQRNEVEMHLLRLGEKLDLIQGQLKPELG